MKKKLLAVLALGGVLFSSISLVEATTLTLGASADTSVKYLTPSDNYGSDPTLVVGHHGDETAALIKFDLSLLPSSAIINSAILNLAWVGGSSSSGDLYWYQDPPGSGNWINSGYYLPPWMPKFEVHKVNMSNSVQL